MDQRVSPEKLAAADQRRRNPTPSEAALWAKIKGASLGAAFRREVHMWGYCADFACLAHRLVVEVDGGYHGEPDQRAKDDLRDQRLAERGWRTLRFPAALVLADVGAVASVIARALWESAGAHPNRPSIVPKREPVRQPVRQRPRHDWLAERPHAEKRSRKAERKRAARDAEPAAQARRERLRKELERQRRPPETVFPAGPMSWKRDLAAGIRPGFNLANVRDAAPIPKPEPPSVRPKKRRKRFQLPEQGRG